MPTSVLTPILSPDEINVFLAKVFPQLNPGNKRTFDCEAVGPGTARMRMAYDHGQLRPGGTISGPARFALADVGLYVAILAHIGPVPLAVTTTMSINFLRKPGAKDLIAECRLLKLGKRLAVGEVLLFSDGDPDIVAHVTGTYSIPPPASGGQGAR